ncbi:helix-turn-helix domain-containing protein [Streptomyces sp. PvR034]|uniref:helix-turn-helix domain-containing protein n=1 Tax=Streptomyces sp. PvR034 TaxID=3156401 RepID=UPI003399091D
MRHTSRFVVVGNHLAQHCALSLVAIGLATHIQSLPAGTRVGIKRLAERFPEGEVRIASAMRELETYGYLKRVRVRLATGQVITRTVSYNQPGAAYLEGATDQVPLPARDDDPAPEVESESESELQGAVPELEPEPAAELEPEPVASLAADPEPAPVLDPDPDPDPDPETDPEPQGPAPGPGPGGRPVSRGSSLGPLFGAGSAVAPGRGCGAAGAAGAGAPAGALGAGGAPAGRVRQEAFDLLVELRLRDPRLLLPARAVRQLAPEVSGWLDLGVEPEAVAHLLAGNLPAELGNPAALIAYRLRAQVPPRLPAPRAAPPTARPDPFQTCDGCERAFRAPAPGGYCRDCGPAGQRAA